MKGAIHEKVELFISVVTRIFVGGFGGTVRKGTQMDDSLTSHIRKKTNKKQNPFDKKNHLMSTSNKYSPIKKKTVQIRVNMKYSINSITLHYVV